MQNQRLIAAVLVGLLGSGSAVADASDWLPLAVGNSWTYSHQYSDYGNYDVYSQWPNYATSESGEFTLSVLRTEDIDGQTTLLSAICRSCGRRCRGSL